MDCELQYHAGMGLPGKHAKAVKRMTARLHCRESREMVPLQTPIGPFTLARICSAALCRRGTASIHAGLFQHISGI